MDQPTAPRVPDRAGSRPAADLQKDGRHEEALQGAEALLADLPENRDLLLIAAISLRYLLRIRRGAGDAATAWSGCSRASAVCTGARPLLRRAEGCAPAIEALLRAVNINPALPAELAHAARDSIA